MIPRGPREAAASAPGRKVAPSNGAECTDTHTAPRKKPPPLRYNISEPPPSSADSGVPPPSGSSGPHGTAHPQRWGTDLHAEKLKQIRKLNQHLIQSFEIPDYTQLGRSQSMGELKGMQKQTETMISLSPYLQAKPKLAPSSEAAEKKPGMSWGAVPTPSEGDLEDQEKAPQIPHPDDDDAAVLQATCPLWARKHKFSYGRRPGGPKHLTLERIRMMQQQEAEAVKRKFGSKSYPVSAAAVDNGLVMPKPRLKYQVGLCATMPRLVFNPLYVDPIISNMKGKGGKRKKK